MTAGTYTQRHRGIPASWCRCLKFFSKHVPKRTTIARMLPNVTPNWIFFVVIVGTIFLTGSVLGVIGAFRYAALESQARAAHEHALELNGALTERTAAYEALTASTSQALAVRDAQIAQLQKELTTAKQIRTRPYVIPKLLPASAPDVERLAEADAIAEKFSVDASSANKSFGVPPVDAAARLVAGRALVTITASEAVALTDTLGTRVPATLSELEASQRMLALERANKQSLLALLDQAERVIELSETSRVQWIKSALINKDLAENPPLLSRNLFIGAGVGAVLGSLAATGVCVAAQ